MVKSNVNCETTFLLSFCSPIIVTTWIMFPWHTKIVSFST